MEGDEDEGDEGEEEEGVHLCFLGIGVEERGAGRVAGYSLLDRQRFLCILNDARIAPSSYNPRDNSHASAHAACKVHTSMGGLTIQVQSTSTRSHVSNDPISMSSLRCRGLIGEVSIAAQATARNGFLKGTDSINGWEVTKWEAGAL